MNAHLRRDAIEEASSFLREAEYVFIMTKPHPTGRGDGDAEEKGARSEGR